MISSLYADLIQRLLPTIQKSYNFKKKKTQQIDKQ
jgi:hypothetical protein